MRLVNQIRGSPRLRKHPDQSCIGRLGAASISLDTTLPPTASPTRRAGLRRRRARARAQGHTLPGLCPPGQRAYASADRADVADRGCSMIAKLAGRPVHGTTVTAATTEGEAAPRKRPPLPLLLAVLGVVYGDIGTSPLYALRASLHMFEGIQITSVEVLGILSLIFWSLILIVTVKYVTLIMRADNHGEGGILALMALAQRVSVGTHMRNVVALVGIAGACLFFGDGIITPAISVLSAVEGLEVSTPGLAEFVLPISVVVIVVLFAVQWRGTTSVGRVFGPVMAVWFVVIGAARPGRDHPAPVRPAGDFAALRGHAVHPVPRSWPSWCSAPWCCASPAPRRCMPTWGISARTRSG